MGKQATPPGDDGPRAHPGQRQERVSNPQPPVHYEITIEGILDPRWPTRFDALQLTSGAAGRTTITGPVADQAALHGLLARIRDLGLAPCSQCAAPTATTSDT